MKVSVTKTQQLLKKKFLTPLISIFKCIIIPHIKIIHPIIRRFKL
nr:MAG TPA: hypothetical protein [Caudoviricetes sp.]